MKEHECRSALAGRRDERKGKRHEYTTNHDNFGSE
jgi:hypothetical protein